MYNPVNIQHISPHPYISMMPIIEEYCILVARSTHIYRMSLQNLSLEVLSEVEFLGAEEKN